MTSPETHSLPLMGIRNAIGIRDNGLLPAKLTTPHGDQKRRAEAASSVLGSSSLPLMGIRNTLPSQGRRRPKPAHYPSWGSETALI